MRCDHEDFFNEFIKTNNEILQSCYNMQNILLNSMIQLKQFIIEENLRKLNNR